MADFNKKTEWKRDDFEKKQGFEKFYYNQFLPYENAKKLTFGEGERTIKIDSLYGLWAGNESYSLAPTRISSQGTVYVNTIYLKNYSATKSDGTIGEIMVANGTLYICTAVSPITWTKVGAQ
jgi:hypothetical protein